MGARRVLVVDDEAAQREWFSRFLDAKGFRPILAASAAEALAKISAGGERPDLILIDISMPEVDGIALMKALRASAPTALIPMILMSGLSVPSSLMEAAAEALGAGSIFAKGGDSDALLARVRRSLELPAPPASGGFTIIIDPVKRTIRVGDRLLPRLPAHRFQLLCALARTPHPIGREELLALIWDGSDNLNVVDVTIARLRRDLKAFPLLSIETTPAGYRLLIGKPPASSG